MIAKTKPSTSILLLVFKSLNRSLNMTTALSFKIDFITKRTRIFYKY